MQEMSNSFNYRLDNLDLSLFDIISSESSDGDRRSLLAVQRAVRQPSGYVYLEIGSHLGGSIQQHLLDPWCRRIISIDKRPPCQPDDRGEVYHYAGNSTARMVENLRRVAPEELGKLSCHDSDTKGIQPNSLHDLPDFCFIDGEHTYAAVLADFEFCLSVSAPNVTICFHDDYIIWKALRVILASLRQRGIPFTASKLDGTTFGIFLRASPAAKDPYIRACSRGGFRWLWGRRLREFLPNWLRPTVRRIATWFKR